MVKMLPDPSKNVDFSYLGEGYVVDVSSACLNKTLMLKVCTPAFLQADSAVTSVCLKELNLYLKLQEL